MKEIVVFLLPTDSGHISSDHNDTVTCSGSSQSFNSSTDVCVCFSWLYNLFSKYIDRALRKAMEKQVSMSTNPDPNT